MNVNVSLDGYTQGIVNQAIKKGIVKTKAEAIRFALLLFGKEYKLEDINLEEVIKVNKRIKEEMEEIKKEKLKLIPWEKVKAEAGI